METILIGWCSILAVALVWTIFKLHHMYQYQDAMDVALHVLKSSNENMRRRLEKLEGKNPEKYDPGIQ